MNLSFEVTDDMIQPNGGVRIQDPLAAALKTGADPNLDLPPEVKKWLADSGHSCRYPAVGFLQGLVMDDLLVLEQHHDASTTQSPEVFDLQGLHAYDSHAQRWASNVWLRGGKASGLSALGPEADRRLPIRKSENLPRLRD